MKKASTTAKGNAFRDQVSQLLRSAGMDVDTERLLQYKDVDVIAKQTNLGITRTYVIECKDYGHTFGKEEVSKVWADYSALLNSNFADELWLVLRKECSAAAKAYAETQPRFRVLTIETLQNTIIDFSKHIQAITNDDAIRKLSKYYVRPKNTKKEDLIDLILSWIDSEVTKPMAILGGYGKGKSSLARSLALQLANSHLRESGKRIPILIPLGEISSEQSLEGLIGKHFTTVASANGYTFGAFCQLNHDGRFVVILDGFDEMKHAITWEQFRFNFKEINRLVVGRAKVIVLGRPTAFSSEEEFDWILKGTRRQGPHELRVAGAPSYITCEIGDLEVKESYELIENYISSLIPTDAKGDQLKQQQEFLVERMKVIRELSYGNLIARPVHAKILADLAAEPGIKLREFTKFDLYDLFINQTIERESAKTARKSFKDGERRRFARELAWWLWKRASAPNVTADMIPDSIVSLFIKNIDDNHDSIRRDLVTSCFLEKKTGDVLYFPHRSFQEFLIAEHFLLESITSSEVGLVSELMTEEIYDCVVSSNFRTLTSKWLLPISEYSGTLSLRFLRAFSLGWTVEQRFKTGDPLAFSQGIFPAGLIAEYLSVDGVPLTDEDGVEYAAIIKGIINSAQSPNVVYAGLMVLQFLSGRSEPVVQKAATYALTTAILENIDWVKVLNKLSSSNKQKIVYSRFNDHWTLRMFAKHFRIIGVGAERIVSIDGAAFQDDLVRLLSKQLVVTDIEKVRILPVIRLGNDDLVGYLDNRRSALSKYWQRYITLGGNPADIDTVASG